MFQKIPRKLYACLAILAFGILLTAPLGISNPKAPLIATAEAGFFDQELEVFEEVADLISEKYVYPLDYKKLYAAAIRQMVETAGPEKVILQEKNGSTVISVNRKNVRFQLNFNADNNQAAFRKAYSFLAKATGGKPAKEKLEVAGIIGMMNSLDIYSQYLDKSAFDKSMRDTEGKYGGLGMVITMKDDRLVVVKAMRTGPAHRAGIMTDDVFLKVNGKELKNVEIQALAEMLRGYPNTKVTVTLLRPSDNKELSYTLTREIILIETVISTTLEEKIGYIKIESFSKQTNDQLMNALAKAKKDNVTAYIIDLRDNPGGLLNQSVNVASHFLYRDRMVVYTQGRNKRDYKEYRALYKKNLLHMPLVVLINRHSASAAEIVAGALRDSGKALIIGENSYGKGSVQTIFRIGDGSGIRLTTSKYYTPSGVDITEHGIVPEIKIVKDILDDETRESRENKSKNKEGDKSLPSIQITESGLNNFLKQQSESVTGEDYDPTLQFARLIIKNVTIANKKQTLAKARELASNIHY